MTGDPLDRIEQRAREHWAPPCTPEDVLALTGVVRAARKWHMTYHPAGSYETILGRWIACPVCVALEGAFK